MEQIFSVVGIGIYTSKKTGKESRVLHLSTPINDVKYGVGSQVSTEFISADKFKEAGVKLGDSVRLSYARSFDGRAYVNGVHVVDNIPPIQTK